ncbi:protein of unknown function [Burkholderia multivorans]
MNYFQLADGRVAAFDNVKDAPAGAAAITADQFASIATTVAETPDQIESDRRALRDAALAETDWLVMRHRDERDAGDSQTLTADQYATLLNYRKTLRDMPVAAGWPNVDLPAAPDFVTAIA